MIKISEIGLNNRIFKQFQVNTVKFAGFTLIELLVVLVVIGISTSLVAVNYFPDHQKALNKETKRLSLILSHASEYAKTHGKVVAFDFNNEGYRFYSRDARSTAWTLVADDTILRERKWPSGIKPISLKINQSLMNQNPSSSMRILFSSSGLNEDFTLTFRYEELKSVIHGNLLGQIQYS